MSRAILLLTVVAVVCLAPLAVLADDVTVDKIEPDKTKPADQPKTTSDRPPATDRVRTDLGDRRLDQALGGLSLTAEQATKIKEAGADIAKQMQANNDALRKELETLRGQQDAGEKTRQLFSDNRTKNDELRKQLVEKLNPLLTDEQQAKLKERLAQPDRRFGGTPEENARQLIGGIAERAGITLSDEQKKKITEKLTKLTQEQATQGRETFQKMRELGEKARTGDEAAKKELDELRGKMGEQFRNGMKAYNDAIVAELTPEQKTKFDEAQAKMRIDREKMMTDGLVRRAERAGATDEQKAKITDLAKAAQEAMGKLGPDDDKARGELRAQLEKDIAALLTEEQKKKFEEDRGGFFRRGGQGGRGGDANNNNGGGRRGNRGDRGNRGGNNNGGDKPTTPPSTTPPI